MGKKFKPLIFLLIFLSTAAAIFYLENRVIRNIGEKKDVEAVNETKRTVSADIPIIKIGEDIVYYPEFEFYLLATKKDYESSLGDGVWKVIKNGRSMEELLKTGIVEEIARLKIVVNEAKKAGCSLTPKEEEEIKKEAKAQIKGIDPVLKARYYLDEELITRIYMENFLATRFFYDYTKKAGAKDDEEARLMFNSAYDSWESGYTADIYWDNIDRINIDAMETAGK